MFQQYIYSLITQIEYQKDDSGMIFAYIPGYPEYITEGETFEQARTNMIEIIEDISIHKLSTGNQQISKAIHSFTNSAVEYA